MSEAAPKICCMCKKDVSAAKHARDKRGRYYCAACFETAKKRAAAAAATGAPAAAAPAKHAASAQSSSATAVATAAPPATMPEFCPGCGAKVFANRSRCMKCGGDVMEMQRKAAAKPKDPDRPATEEIVGTWVGRIARVGLVLLVVGVVVFSLYGLKLLFLPGGLWDNFPTTREAAVREFLADISAGTPKSYANAFMLISFRERTTGRSGEEERFTSTFARMHDDFAKKYGGDWLSTIKLENLGSNDNYPDDEVDFKLTLGKDTYIIATQVQIDTTKAAANMTLPRKKKPVYNEDGKRRFGILDITGYQPHEKRHMAEMVGPGQPEQLDEPNMNP